MSANESQRLPFPAVLGYALTLGFPPCTVCTGEVLEYPLYNDSTYGC